MKNILLLIPLFAVCFTACFNNKKKSTEVVSIETTDTVMKEPPALGKYVYVDSKGTLHTKRYCFSKPYTIADTVISGDGGGSGSPIMILSTDTLEREDFKMVCPICIKDEQFDTIINRIANKTKGPKRKSKIQL